MDAAFTAALPAVLKSVREGEQHPSQVAPTLRAGSAVLFDIRVLHRGLANASPGVPQTRGRFRLSSARRGSAEAAAWRRDAPDALLHLRGAVVS